MTVATTAATTGPLPGNGATTAFAYNFIIPYQSDGVTPACQVVYTSAAGVEAVLAPNLYTISGVENPAGGTVNYSSNGPIATGTFLTITRTVAYTQPDAFPNQAFYPESVETGLDNLELQIQQLYALPDSAAGSAASAAASAAAAAASAALAGRFDLDYATQIATSTIPGTYNYIRVAGYSSIGDSNEFMLYKRHSGAPSHSLYFQSLDGAYWEYQPGPNGVNTASAGLISSTATTYGAAQWNKAAAYAQQYKSGNYSSGFGPFINLFVPPGNYKFNAPLLWDPNCFGVVGYGAIMLWAVGSANGIVCNPTSYPSGAPSDNIKSGLSGLTLFGPSDYLSGQSGIKFVPTSYAAAHMFVRDCAIAGWQRGSFFGANAYLIHFDHTNIYENAYGLLDTAGASNAGENISFSACGIFNNAITGGILSNVNSSYHFTDCSIDYNGLGVVSADNSNFTFAASLQVSIKGGHIENTTMGLIIGGGAGSSGFTTTLVGVAIIFVASSGAVPNIDLKGGFNLTMIGCSAIFNNSSTTPIKVAAAATFNDVGNFVAYSGSYIVAATGAHLGNLVTTTV